CILILQNEVAISLVPPKSAAFPVGRIAPRSIHPKRLRIGSVDFFQRVRRIRSIRILVKNVRQPELHRLPVIVDHLWTMACGIEPEDSEVWNSRRRARLCKLDLISRAAVRVAIGLNPGGEASRALGWSLR